MMKMYKALWVAVVAAVTSGGAVGQGLEEMPAQRAQRAAQVVLEAMGQIKDAPVSVEADVEHAVGLHVKGDGMLLVPQKGIQREEARQQDFRAEQGAALGYLFMTEAFCPVVDGKPVAAKRMRSFKVLAKDGRELTVRCFLLAVRQVSDDDWRLYVYGAEKKPLLEPRFVASERPGSGPLAMDIEDVTGYQGTLAITVLGKYKAGFRVSYQP